MAETIRCPRCRHEQPQGPTCVSCGLDFQKYREHRRKKQEGQTGQTGRNVRCPYCKTEQPLRALCMKCGLDFKAYSRYIKRKKAGEDVAPPMPPARPPAPGEAAAAPATPGALDPARPMELEELFKRTWEIFKERWLTLVTLNILYIVVVVLSIIPMAFIFSFISEEPDPLTLGALISAMVLLALVVAFAAMGTLFAAAADKGLSIGGAIRTGISKAPAFIWIMFLQSLIVMGGLMFFIVPGFIFMVWFAFAPFIMFTEDVRGMPALLKSREYVCGHGWDVFFKLVVIMVLYMVVGSVPIIGPLVGVPFMLLFIVMMYRDHVRIKGTETPYPADTWSRFKWPLAGLAGSALPVVVIAALLVPFIGALKDMETGQQADMFSSITSPEGTTELSTGKDAYAPGEPVTVNYHGMPGNEQDWVTVAGALASEDSYGEYFYTGGVTEGTMQFRGLEPGQYEVRAFHDWPNGGYEIRARYHFIVEAAAHGAPRLMLEQEDFAPGDNISVGFSVPSGFPAYGWAGIVSSALPHGDESLNRDNTTVFKLLGGRTSGKIGFVAPVEPGSYDVRLHDMEGGSEVFHISFSVTDDASPRTVRVRADSDEPMQVMVQIQVLNYEALVLLNDSTLYSVPGQPEMDYNHTAPATLPASLIAGRNVFRVRYRALPEAPQSAIRIKVYTRLPGGGERVLARWSVFSPSGTRDFTIEVEGAGIRA
ncbi:MAG: hypothetical protein KAR83_08255 [Thermodesulfovibrionales bacterium]|nr:hypothetical protein [Thermodesulfovibrionales bacterium]